MKKAIKMIAGACAAAVVCAGGLLYYNLSRQNVRHTSATFVMDAVADQKVYGPNGEKAIAAAEQAFREMENRLSVYKEGSDIARLNAAAGSGEAVAVEAQTYALLSQAKTLSAQAGVCVVLPLRAPIMRLFVGADESAVALGASYLFLMAFFYLLPAYTNGLQGYFRGLGDMKITLAGTFTQISVRVVFVYLLVPRMGLTAVAWASLAGWLCMLLL